MHRMLPNPPPLSGVRRYLGAVPHGMPTAMTFTASVAGIAFTSLLVVEAAIPGGLGPVVDAFPGAPGAEAHAERARVPDGSPSSPPSQAPASTPLPQVAVVMIEPASQVPDGAGTDGTGSPPAATDRASAPGDEGADPDGSAARSDDDHHADSPETAPPTITTDGTSGSDSEGERDGSWAWPGSEPLATASPVSEEEDRPTPTPSPSPSPSPEPHDD